MHQITWFWPQKIEKSPYRGRGGHPPPTPFPPLGRFAPSGLVAPLPSHFPLQVGNHPPHFWRPVYAPVGVCPQVHSEVSDVYPLLMVK